MVAERLEGFDEVESKRKLEQAMPSTSGHDNAVSAIRAAQDLVAGMKQAKHKEDPLDAIDWGALGFSGSFDAKAPVDSPTKAHKGSAPWRSDMAAASNCLKAARPGGGYMADSGGVPATSAASASQVDAFRAKLKGGHAPAPAAPTAKKSTNSSRFEWMKKSKADSRRGVLSPVGPPPSVLPPPDPSQLMNFSRAASQEPAKWTSPRSRSAMDKNAQNKMELDLLMPKQYKSLAPADKTLAPAVKAQKRGKRGVRRGSLPPGPLTSGHGESPVSVVRRSSLPTGPLTSGHGEWRGQSMAGGGAVQGRMKQLAPTVYAVEREGGAWSSINTTPLTNCQTASATASTNFDTFMSTLEYNRFTTANPLPGVTGGTGSRPVR